MFDDNNDNSQQGQADDNAAAPVADIFSGSQGDPGAQDSGTDNSAPLGAPVLPSVEPPHASSDESAAPAVAEPLDTSNETPEEPAAEQPSAPAEDSTSDVMTTPPSEDLASMKQEALSQLQPLVAHLNQTPEEEFRTTMMMIQANDDQSLLKKAFESAKKITDDKARAQALLDVINEINYFTQAAE